MIEFWAYAIREPRLRDGLAARFATLRSASARLIAQGAAHRGVSIDGESADRLGLVITSLGNGLALQKLIDPDSVPDELYGDALVLIFGALTALARSAGEDPESEGLDE